MNQNLAEDMLNQLERENGSYNEDLGKFGNQSSEKSREFPKIRTNDTLPMLQDRVYQIIQKDGNLMQLIKEHKVCQEVINEILSHEDWLRDLLNNDPPTVVKAITNLLTSELRDHEAEQENEQEEDVPVNKMGTVTGYNKQKIGQHQMESHSQNEIVTRRSDGDGYRFGSPSFSDLLIGPIIAVIAYFLVSNTPLIFMLGQIPYVGSLLVGNKLLTSMGLIFVIFSVLSFLVDYSGLF